jgi:hypothetical protein
VVTTLLTEMEKAEDEYVNTEPDPSDAKPPETSHEGGRRDENEEPCSVKSGNVISDCSFEFGVAHTFSVELGMDPLTIYVCDAVSGLIRVGVTAHTEAFAHFGIAPWGDLQSLTASLRLVDIIGEFASQKEGSWESFLEPLAIVVVCTHSAETGTDIQISDTLVDATFPNNVSPHSTLESGHALSLNLTAQFVRSAMSLCNQFAELQAAQQSATSAVDAAVNDTFEKVPLFWEDRLTALTTKLQPVPRGSDSRISAMNCTGLDVSAWFHCGHELKAAKQEAMAVHWRSTDAPEAHTVLFGHSSSQATPCPLDPYCSVPASTAVALQVNGEGIEISAPFEICVPVADSIGAVSTDRSDKPAKPSHFLGGFFFITIKIQSRCGRVREYTS